MQKEESRTIAGVEHPSHYQSNDRLEFIEEMRLMFGDEAKDRAKALWYLKFYALCEDKQGERQ